jgi:hypothetical protein
MHSTSRLPPPAQTNNVTTNSQCQHSRCKLWPCSWTVHAAVLPMQQSLLKKCKHTCCWCHAPQAEKHRSLQPKQHSCNVRPKANPLPQRSNGVTWLQPCTLTDLAHTRTIYFSPLVCRAIPRTTQSPRRQPHTWSLACLFD